MNEAVARLALVSQSVPVDLTNAVIVESWSNDTWVTGDSVLRVCWQGDRERLLREKVLLEALPLSIPHATVIASGRVGDLTWTLMRRIEGERLDHVWRQISLDEQRDAVMSIGVMLRALHEWVQPLKVRELLLELAQANPTTREAVVGSSILPLPLRRLTPLINWIEELPGMNEELSHRVRRRVDELGPAISDLDFEDGVVVHGDAHFANVLWHDGRVVALLDFEWTRLGPSDLEFEAACREDPLIETLSVSGPLHVSEIPMLMWLRDGYPALFERENLTERVWLYELCHQIRRLSASGIDAVDADVLHRLEILVAGPRVKFS